MKIPKEIYLLQKGSQLLGTWSGTPQIEISGGWYSAEYKYIRADLVEQKPALDDYLKATPADRRKMSMTGILEKEQHPKIIQWTGKNLKEVIDFTGKSPRFDEWFKSWEEYENYVHTHNDILKLFCEDGSHYEVPVGAWIVKTPDGHNVPSVAKYIQQEQPSLPANVDEAAIQAAQIDMCDRQIMEDSNEHRMLYSRIFRRGFKAGAEWMASREEQEQPEVDLEKEIEDYWEKICDDEFGELILKERETAWFDDIARHFYELGRTGSEESVSVAESPSKTFPRVNEFDCGSSYRH